MPPDEIGSIGSKGRNSSSQSYRTGIASTRHSVAATDFGYDQIFSNFEGQNLLFVNLCLRKKSVDRRRGRRERSRSNSAKHSRQSHLPGFLWISIGFDSHFTGRSDRRRGRLWACCQLKDLETVATLSGVGPGAKDWAEL